MKFQRLFKYFFIVFIFILYFSATCVLAKRTITLSSGFKGGTYYTIAKEISKMDKTIFNVVHSKGTVENIHRVRSSKNTYGIVQLDVLQNLMFFDEKVQKDIKVLFLLHSEELHILANKKIKSIKELRDGNVYLGSKHSGSRSTSLIILSSLLIGVRDINMVDAPLTTVVSNLLSGEIDALFLVSGAPVSLLSKISKDSRAKNLHFLSIPNKSINFLTRGNLPYNKQLLGKQQYPFLIEKPIQTISVHSAFIINTKASKKKIIHFMKLLFADLPRLQKLHIKFKEIDLNNTIKYYKEYPEAIHPIVVSFFQKLKSKKK